MRINTPISEKVARSLHAGEIVHLSGTLYTMRDEAHMRALKVRPPVEIRDMAIYHCGPVMRSTPEGWEVIAAGPTTSSRMDRLEPEFIRRFRPRAIIGKGGMGSETRKTMAEVGTVYLAMTGGAAVLAARAVERVVDVHWLDLGMPEALWVLRVRNFGPLVVGIDAHGEDLFEDIRQMVRRRLPAVKQKLGITS